MMTSRSAILVKALAVVSTSIILAASSALAVDPSPRSTAGLPSPEASPAPIPALAVLAFESAAFEQGEDVESLSLTLTGGPGNVVWFADRPHREVGTMSMEDWISALSSMADDPPNAALVARDAQGGEEEVVVIELLSGRSDAASGETTYQVRVLDDIHEVDREFQHQVVSDVAPGATYEAGYLFVDDWCRLLLGYQYLIVPC